MLQNLRINMWRLMKQQTQPQCLKVIHAIQLFFGVVRESCGHSLDHGVVVLEEESSIGSESRGSLSENIYLWVRSMCSFTESFCTPVSSTITNS